MSILSLTVIKPHISVSAVDLAYMLDALEYGNIYNAMYSNTIHPVQGPQTLLTTTVDLVLFDPSTAEGLNNANLKSVHGYLKSRQPGQFFACPYGAVAYLTSADLGNTGHDAFMLSVEPFGITGVWGKFIFMIRYDANTSEFHIMPIDTKHKDPDLNELPWILARYTSHG